MLRYLCLFLTLMMISGCSVITSRKLSINQPSAEATAAYYFLPKARIHIQVLEKKDNTQKHALQYVETIIVPDESEFFLLDYNQSSLSSDILTVQLTTDGLLRKVDTAVEDKSGEVIVKLVELGKQVAKALIFPTSTSVGESPIIIRDLIFSLSDLSDVNSQLLKIKPENFKIDLKPMVSLSSSNEGGDNKSSSGICFRALMPYSLKFFDGEAVIEQRILLLPDGSPKICMPIERAVFVRKVTNLTFDRGILTEVHIEKPSEVLGFMDIPVSIAKAIASMPAELIQLKINYSNQEKDLADARKAELEAKQGLLEYLKKVPDDPIEH